VGFWVFSPGPAWPNRPLKLKFCPEMKPHIFFSYFTYRFKSAFKFTLNFNRAARAKIYEYFTEATFGRARWPRLGQKTGAKAPVTFGLDLYDNAG
jgi:hypothetical protein